MFFRATSTRWAIKMLLLLLRSHRIILLLLNKDWIWESLLGILCINKTLFIERRMLEFVSLSETAALNYISAALRLETLSSDLHSRWYNDLNFLFTFGIWTFCLISSLPDSFCWDITPSLWGFSILKDFPFIGSGSCIITLWRPLTISEWALWLRFDASSCPLLWSSLIAIIR